MKAQFSFIACQYGHFPLFFNNLTFSLQYKSLNASSREHVRAEKEIAARPGGGRGRGGRGTEEENHNYRKLNLYKD